MYIIYNEDIKSIYYQIYQLIDEYVREYNNDLNIQDNNIFKIYLNDNKDKYIEVKRDFNKITNIYKFKITTTEQIYTFEIDMDNINDIVSSCSFRNWFRNILLESYYNVL